MIAATRPFHGSRIVATAFIANAVSVGCTIGIFGVFVGVAAEELGSTAARARWVAMSLQLVLALGSPVLGAVLARRSIRAVMLGGCVLLALGLAVVSRAQLPWQIVLAYPALVSVGALSMGVLPASTLVSAWYARRRGRFLGVSLAGTTAGTAVLPPVSAWLIEQVGWRDALAIVGLSASALAFAAVWMWAVRRPAELGQMPDGDPSAPSAPAPAAPRAAELLRQRRFWIIVGIFGLLFMPGIVTLFYGVEFAMERGMSLQGGALLISGRALLGMAGKVVLGSACDRFDKRAVLGVAIAAEVGLWAAFSFTASIPVFVAASLGLGFFGASLTAVQASIVASTFGPDAFSHAMGWLNGCKLPFTVASAWLAGALFEWYGGSWASAFASFLLVFAGAAVLTALLRLPAPVVARSPVSRPA